MGCPRKFLHQKQVQEGDCVEGGGAAEERRKMDEKRKMKGRKGLPHH